MTLDLTNDGAGRRSRSRGVRLLLAVTAAIALGAPAVASASTPLPPAPGGNTAHSLIPTPQLPPLPGYLVVTVAFRGGGGYSTPASTPDLTTSALADTIRHTINPWFAAVSHGKYSGGTTTRRGPITIQPKKPFCSPDWRAEVPDLADAEVRKQGVEPRNYQAVIYYFSHIPAAQGCNFDGAADFPEQGNSVLLNGTTSLTTLAHELGHNLGLGHAGAMFCADANGNRMPLNYLLSGSCTQEEYGDEYSAMGNLYPMGYSSAQLAQLGWNAGHMATISSDSPPVTLFLTPIEDDVAGSTQAVHLTDDHLWLEYRRKVGVDDILDAPIFGGLLVRAEAASRATPPAQHVAPFLLDMSPLDLDYKRTTLPVPRVHWRPEMTVGQTWSNPQGNMKITLNSSSVLGASVTIQSKVVYGTVPNLRGMTTFAATNAIVAAGFERGAIGRVTDPLCENLNRVLTQSPAAGTRLQQGYPVTYSYGVAPASGCPDTRQ